MKDKYKIGSRVVLTPPSIEDRDEFLEQVEKSRDIHFPWVTPPANPKQFNEYIDKIHRENQHGFCLKLNTTHKIIGVINISEVVQGCFQSGYLGFYIFYDYQGQGLMSEGLHKALKHAFSKLNLHRLEANIQPDNKPSISLVKRAGFKHEGFSKHYLFINNAWRDHERFALTKEDFSIDYTETDK